MISITLALRDLNHTMCERMYGALKIIEFDTKLILENKY